MSFKLNSKTAKQIPNWEEFRQKVLKDVITDLEGYSFSKWEDCLGELGHRKVTMKQTGCRVELICEAPEWRIFDVFVYKTVEEVPHNPYNY